MFSKAPALELKRGSRFASFHVPDAD